MTDAQKTAEQLARDMLERMGIPDAQSYSAGNLAELANLIDATRTPVVDSSPRPLQPICYAMAQDILVYKVPRVGRHIPGVYDVPLFTGDQVAAAVAREREACAVRACDFLTKGRSPLGRRVADAIRGGD